MHPGQLNSTIIIIVIMTGIQGCQNVLVTGEEGYLYYSFIEYNFKVKREDVSGQGKMYCKP